MFALLQDQHNSQLEAMAAANKVTMDAMMEHMIAILEGTGGRRSKWDTENTLPSTNANNGGNNKNRLIQLNSPYCASKKK